jgi:hypothetical protein
MGLGVSMSDQKPAAWDEPVAWLRQRDNTLAVNDGGLFGSDWTPLYYAALAQPEQEQEPVAWRYLEDPFGANEYLITDDPETAKGPGWTPLYTAPPQRKPLTLQEVDEIWSTKTDIESVVRAVEKAHGIS